MEEAKVNERVSIHQGSGALHLHAEYGFFERRFKRVRYRSKMREIVLKGLTLLVIGSWICRATLRKRNAAMLYGTSPDYVQRQAFD